MSTDSPWNRLLFFPSHPPTHPLSLCPSPWAEVSCKTKTKPSHSSAEDSRHPLSLWPLLLQACAGMMPYWTDKAIYYLCNQLPFFPLWVFFVLSHICGLMLEDGRRNQEEVINLSSYLLGRQVAERWPCKSYWHWGDIHLVYPYSQSPCPFMKTCAICHRVSPWRCSLINRSMRDGGDLLAQRLSGLEPRDSAAVQARKSSEDGNSEVAAS